jgi:hypothetical protein
VLAQRRVLGLYVVVDVDARRHRPDRSGHLRHLLFARRSRVFRLVGRGLPAHVRTALGRDPPDLLTAGEVDRGLVQLRRPRLVVDRALEGGLRDQRRPDVVGVPVAAEVVVADDHVGRYGTHDRQEPRDGLVEVGLPEARGRVVLGGSHHPRVDVPEEVVLDRAEVTECPAQFFAADLRESSVVLRRVELRYHDLAVLAACAGDADDAHALGRVARHNATGRDRLVVGVSVDGQQRQRLWHQGHDRKPGRAAGCGC